MPSLGALVGALGSRGVGEIVGDTGASAGEVVGDPMGETVESDAGDSVGTPVRGSDAGDTVGGPVARSTTGDSVGTGSKSELGDRVGSCVAIMVGGLVVGATGTLEGRFAILDDLLLDFLLVEDDLLLGCFDFDDLLLLFDDLILPLPFALPLPFPFPDFDLLLLTLLLLLLLLLPPFPLPTNRCRSFL